MALILQVAQAWECRYTNISPQGIPKPWHHYLLYIWGIYHLHYFLSINSFRYCFIYTLISACLLLVILEFKRDMLLHLWRCVVYVITANSMSREVTQENCNKCEPFLHISWMDSNYWNHYLLLILTGIPTASLKGPSSPTSPLINTTNIIITGLCGIHTSFDNCTKCLRTFGII